MPLNVVAVAGNLTRDAELRMTTGGMPVLSFSVAVNNRKKQGGDWVDDPAFIPCVMFGSRAQSISQHLHKGLKVGVSGRLSESRWEDNGKRRSRLEVIVSDIDFMQQKGAGSGGFQTESQPTPQHSQAYQPAPEPNYQQGRLTGADDIPF